MKATIETNAEYISIHLEPETISEASHLVSVKMNASTDTNKVLNVRVARDSIYGVVWLPVMQNRRYDTPLKNQIHQV